MTTIEERYQKLTQREHVLLKSGMYIGQTKKQCEELWCVDSNGEQMEKKMVEYSPGFLKIVDEIISNAIDQSTRQLTVPVTQIKINYNISTGEISVWNNGDGIPIELHTTHGMYVPELIFGQLLSGSNYSESDSRTTIGTFGIGSKACSIFSKKFTVETVDTNTKKKYIQEFSENMTKKTKPKITSCSGKGYTKITFIPDYQRFEMTGLESDTVSLIRKRALDCIPCTSNTVSVYLNDTKLVGKGLMDYIKLYPLQNGVIYEQFEKNGLIWEYAVSHYPCYAQCSFVNGSATTGGGKHVDYILAQIISKLKNLLETKKKLKDVKTSAIKERLFIFVRATVINPTFNSQTKEILTTPSKDFGIQFIVSDKFIEKIYKSPIVEEIVELVKLKERSDLAKQTDGVKRTNLYGIPNLQDAIYAGGNKSQQCTLILTEGLSAMTFALWGASIIGNQNFGVFSLKGKPLNVRDATTTQLLNNEELNNIKQILGLKQNFEYLDTKSLRYGKVMILTDADNDGFHIKSLFVNWIHATYPSLAKLDFIQTLRTPILKATKGKHTLEFFTEQDYHIWKNSTLNSNGYHIKYFKGLGTSKKEDAQDTFKKMNSLKIEYYHKNLNCDKAILLAFDKDSNHIKTKNETRVSCTDQRKEWLKHYNKDSFIQVDENRVSYQDLINKELIHFSVYDNMRSIPSICDGLKPSQRKILYYMIKNNINKDIKVAQLSGYISATMGYHHGEVSLQGAIIKMAQNFVGSGNNINLLVPEGNFGSRLNSNDAASPRYIFTRLSHITNAIFNPLDLPIYDYLQDDSLEIEPEFLLPIIPMILVNGCSGIGTGFSTTIPNYNPKDLIHYLLNKLKGVKNESDLFPYFNNFNGTIERKDPVTFITKGTWKKLNETVVEITELPVGTWVIPYKDYLETFIENTKVSIKRKFVLKDVKNMTSDENSAIRILIEFKHAKDLQVLIETDTLEKELKLTSSFSTNNMHLFNPKLILTKYSSVDEILDEFFTIRLSGYIKRREYLLKKLKRELTILENKKRFITEYISGILDINKKSKDYTINLLATTGYYNDPDHSFDYLTNIPIISFTSERILELEKQLITKHKEYTYYLESDQYKLWSVDLNNLIKLYF